MKQPGNDLEPAQNPQKFEFSCKITIMDAVPTQALVDAAASTTCKIKVKAENNKQVTDIVADTLTVKLTNLSYGLMNKTNVDNMFSDDLSDTDIQAFKDFVKTQGDDMNFGVQIADDLTLKQIYIKDMDPDQDYISQINKMSAINSTFQANVAKLPVMYENKINIRYIQDQTRPVADENQLRELFDKDFLYAEGSIDCSLPKPTTDSVSKSQMFMNNDAFDLTWDLQAKPEMATVTVTSNNLTYTPFFQNKIYKCKTWYNVVPFTKSPEGMKSFCGVGFGYGSLNNAAGGLNANLIFIKQTGPSGAGDFECILKARALQRFLTQKCMDQGPRPETEEECFKDGVPTSPPEPEAEAPAEPAEEEKELPEDTQPKELGNKVAMDIQKQAETAMAAVEEADLQPEPLHSIKVDIKSKKHSQSLDKYKNLDIVLTNQLLQAEELDPAVQFKPELNARVKEPVYHILNKDQQDEIFNELLSTQSAAEGAGGAGTGGPIDPALLTQCSIAKEKWLEETNKQRGMHQVGALTWSDAVAANAQEQANTTLKTGEMKHADSQSIQPPAGPAGENLAKFSSPQGADAVVTAWYEEVNNVETYDPYKCKDNTVCGHFTALVWKGAKEVGCGCVTATDNSHMQICRQRANDTLDNDTPNMNMPANQPAHVLPKNQYQRYSTLRLGTKEEKENDSVRKIQHQRDAILSNISSQDELVMWCRKLSANNHKMPARGPGIKFIGIIQHDLKQICPGLFGVDAVGEDKAPEEASAEPKKTENNYWQDLVKDEKSTKKLFKSYGALNGDVMELKDGCCQTFTSKRAALFAEWCHTTMRWKVGKGHFHFVSLQGEKVDPQAFITEFTANSCANMDEIMGMLKEITEPGVEVAVEAEAPVIKEGDKTTEVNPDGTVKNSDPAGSSADTPNSNDESKNDPSSAPGGGGGAGGKGGPAAGSPDAPAAAAAAAAAAKGKPAKVSEAADEEAGPISDAPLKGKPKGSKPGKAKEAPMTAESVEESIHYDIYDIGYYDVQVDPENKATIRTKKKDSKGHGFIMDKEEKVVEGYREGNVIYIKFQNGDQIKFFYKTNELVRISADKNVVAKIQPDNSKVIDDKDKMTKSLNNKQGISTVFDVEHNALEGMKVKQHFKYGKDIVYYMEDGTVVMKKDNGELLIIDPSSQKVILDEEGNVKYKDNARFKLRYDMSRPGHTYITDLVSEGADGVNVAKSKPFEQNNNSQFERTNGSLYEVLPGHIRLKINSDGSKTKYTNDRKEVCQPNSKGQVFNTQNRTTFMCDCRNQFIDEWSCKATHGYNQVKKVLELQNAGVDYNKNKHIQTNEKLNEKHDIFEKDFKFLKWYQDKMMDKHNVRKL